MSLIKYNTSDYRPVSFNSFLDRFFNEGFDPSATGGSRFTPQVDIFENEKAFEIQLAVPGMNKNDFAIEMNDGMLTLSGERKFEKEKNDKNFHSIESHYGSFKRSFHLPKEIKADKVEAKYENGILFVTVPKDEKQLMTRQISVK
ncbi:MAG: Hsp20/alpha crystallin family protein [Cyclobacteriaceae bacterium]